MARIASINSYFWCILRVTLWQERQSWPGQEFQHQLYLTKLYEYLNNYSY
jgi:hypothetical protein